MNLREGLKNFRLQELNLVARELGVNTSKTCNRDDLEQAIYAKLTCKVFLDKLYQNLSETTKNVFNTIINCGGEINKELLEKKFGQTKNLPKNFWDQESYQPTGISSLLYKGLIFPEVRQVASRPRTFYVFPEEIKDFFLDFLEGVLEFPTGDQNPPFKSYSVPYLLVSDLFSLYRFIERNNPSAVKKHLLPKNFLNMLQKELLIPSMLPRILHASNLFFIKFLFQLALSADLIIKTSSGWKAKLKNAAWFKIKEKDILKKLWNIYLENEEWDELYYIPQIQFECTGYRNSPPIVRKTVLRFLARLPANQWFSVEETSHAFEKYDVNFLRPFRDYENWKTRGDPGIQTLESWIDLEHKLVRFLVFNPFFWLGITSIGADHEESWEYFKITKLGNSLIQGLPLPEKNVNRRNDQFHLHANFEAILHRDIDLHVRFKMEDLAELVNSSNAHLYKINRQTIWNGLEKGWTFESISQFLEYHVYGTIPQNVLYSIRDWCSLYGKINIKHVYHLHADSPQTLQELMSNNEFSSCILEQLTPSDVTLDENNLENIKNILVKLNIPPKIHGANMLEELHGSTAPDEILDSVKKIIREYIQSFEEIPYKNKIILLQFLDNLSLFNVLTNKQPTTFNNDMHPKTSTTTRILPLHTIYRELQKGIKLKQPMVIQVLILPENHVHHHKLLPFKLKRLGKNSTLYGKCLWTGKFLKVPLAKILRVSFLEIEKM